MPGARTVVLDGVPDPTAPARRPAHQDVPARAADTGGTAEMPVRSDGRDLAEVAALYGIGVQEVAGRHCAHACRVGFCGCAPRFGYFTGLPGTPHVPRRGTPAPGFRAGGDLYDACTAAVRGRPAAADQPETADGNREARSLHRSGTRPCWFIVVTRVEEMWAREGSAAMKNVSTPASSWFMRAIGSS